MASSDPPKALQEMSYARYAEEYLRNLPLEHFMESTPQATQRAIALACLALVHAERPEVQMFNELLLQMRVGKKKRPEQVVPDNMVVVHSEPIKADGSYDVPLQPVGPFWVLEYVCKSSKRKDYEDNFKKYEQIFRVPYYLTFYPEAQELSLYRHDGTRYVSQPPNAAGRYPIPQLELEMGLHEGWMRFWFRGRLLPLPAELQGELNAARREISHLTQQLDQRTQELDQRTQQLDWERQARLALEEELARLRGGQEKPGA